VPSRARAGRRWLLAAGAVAGLLVVVLGAVAGVDGGEAPRARFLRWRERGPVRVWVIEYRSHTGTERRAYIDLPAWYGPRDDPSLPLIISPHGRGATPRANSELWGDLPAQGGFAVVNPEGQGRRLGLYSWGDPGQIDDLARMPTFARLALPWLRIAPGKVYAFGGSMGGQESLLLLARYPQLLAGVAAFDAPVDLARRYYDFRLLRCSADCRRVPDDVTAAEVRELAQVEIGGTPTTAPRAYAERSPLTYAREIAFSHVPLQIWWSRDDRVVVDGKRQSERLYELVRRLNPHAPMLESVGSWAHDADMNARTKLPAALLAFGLLPLPRWPDTAFTPIPARGSGIARRSEVAPVCSIRPADGQLMARLAGRVPAYGWPLKPFDAQHPIRGDFGDPRTVFFLSNPAAPSPQGQFSFHDGIDIIGKPGEPVHPVVSGQVAAARRDRIYVRQGPSLFAYWHLKRAVHVGQHVTARQTVLGYIRPRWRHVHFAESLYGRDINPLLHLRPYTDSTPPTISGLRFTDLRGTTLDPLRLAGRVRVIAGAYDLPSPPVAGAWRNMPVVPALLRWRLTTAAGRTIVPEATAADFRATIPQGGRTFWRTYAPGTFQNFPTVGLHHSYSTPGNYLFDLTRPALDTSNLPAGRYRITVDAADICSNHSSLTELIAVRHASTLVGLHRSSPDR
jgi:poly(3-hydroxybutyrate) depolymerase